MAVVLRSGKNNRTSTYAHTYQQLGTAGHSEAAGRVGPRWTEDLLLAGTL